MELITYYRFCVDCLMLDILYSYIELKLFIYALDLHQQHLTKQKLELKKIEHEYWWFPPVAERHLVRTAMECGLICMNTDGCFYFNVERLQTNKSKFRRCDITSTLLSQSLFNQVGMYMPEWDVYSIV